MNWLDNADSYVCPCCGYECNNPNHLPGGAGECPRCHSRLGENSDGAYWRYDPNANDWGIGGWRCTRCGYKNDNLGIAEELRLPVFWIAGTRYCGQCGARMRGKAPKK